MNECPEKKGVLITHNDHVEIAVDLRIILLHLVLNLINSQRMFTWSNLFILKERKEQVEYSKQAASCQQKARPH